MEIWKLILAVIGGITMLVGVLVMVRATWRSQSEDSWRKIAEKRGARMADLEKEVTDAVARSEWLEQENEIIGRRAARDRARLDWYEKTYGVTPPDIIHSTQE